MRTEPVARPGVVHDGAARAPHPEHHGREDDPGSDFPRPLRIGERRFHVGSHLLGYIERKKAGVPLPTRDNEGGLSMKKRVTPRSAGLKERDLNERQSPNEKFTPAQIIAALELAAGVYMGAAQKLGCSRTTIANYAERYAEVKLAHERILEERLDLAETVLVKAMANLRSTTAVPRVSA
jgi:hypothetical protein